MKSPIVALELLRQAQGMCHLAKMFAIGFSPIRSPSRRRPGCAPLFDW